MLCLHFWCTSCTEVVKDEEEGEDYNKSETVKKIENFEDGKKETIKVSYEKLCLDVKTR